MNILMDYIYHRFGKEQLVRYLQQYAEAYYKPLREELKKGNMDALLAYMKGKYEKEKWEVTFFADKMCIRDRYNTLQVVTCQVILLLILLLPTVRFLAGLPEEARLCGI